MLITTEEYVKGYKPGIHLANITMQYYHKKNQSTVLSNHPSKAKFITEIKSQETMVVLDYKKLFPSERIHDDICKRVWKKEKVKDKFEDYICIVTKIETTLDLGLINYEFDQSKH